MENENKRFKLYEHKDNDYILDNPNKHLDFIEMLGDALTSEEIVNLLNELHEENKELKQENTELKSSIEKLYNKHIDEFFEYYDPTNENDKLKFELEEIYYTQVYEPVEPYDEEIHKMCRILYEAFNEGKNE